MPGGPLFFDSLVHTPDALRNLVAAAGGDRILPGSDYPFDLGVEDPVERVTAAGDAEMMLTTNAAGPHRCPPSDLNQGQFTFAPANAEALDQK